MLRARSPGLNFGVLDTILQKNFVWSIQNETPDAQENLYLDKKSDPLAH